MIPCINSAADFRKEISLYLTSTNPQPYCSYINHLFKKKFVFVIERWFEVSPPIYIDNVIADLFPLIETFYRIFWMRGLCFYYITTIRTLLCSIMISVFYLLQLMPFLYKNPSYNKVTIRILVVEWLCICTTEYKSIH